MIRCTAVRPWLVSRSSSPAAVSARSAPSTTVSENRELLSDASSLLDSLNVNVTLKVDRDMWVRSNDANVEIFTPPEEDLRVRINRRRQRLSLEGAVTTDRGEYQFMSRIGYVKGSPNVLILTHSKSTGVLDADRERDQAVEAEINAAFSEAQQDTAVAEYEKYRTFIDNGQWVDIKMGK